MWSLESSSTAAADTNMNRGPEWATLNETADLYGERPGLVAAEPEGEVKSGL